MATATREQLWREVVDLKREHDALERRLMAKVSEWMTASQRSQGDGGGAYAPDVVDPLVAPEKPSSTHAKVSGRKPKATRKSKKVPLGKTSNALGVSLPNAPRHKGEGFTQWVKRVVQNAKRDVHTDEVVAAMGLPKSARRRVYDVLKKPSTELRRLGSGVFAWAS